MDEYYYDEEDNYPLRPDWSGMDYVSEERLLEECRQRKSYFLQNSKRIKYYQGAENISTNQTMTDGQPATPGKRHLFCFSQRFLTDIRVLLYAIIGIQMIMLVVLACLACKKNKKQQKGKKKSFSLRLKNIFRR